MPFVYGAHIGGKSMTKICSLEEITRHLREDGIAAYPTETFMALGCRAWSERAVAGLYEAKQRPHFLPLPLIAANRAQVEGITRRISEAEKLMERFWPGPLSILFPSSPRAPAALSGGTGHLAVRIPSHSGARELALAVGEPLVASSANISGAPPARDAESMDPALLERAPLVWDAPPKPAGILPSTLVRLLDRDRILVLRQGAVSSQALQEAGFALTYPCRSAIVHCTPPAT
jgi:L-threonylcarbamoyladenylate synthase